MLTCLFRALASLWRLAVSLFAPSPPPPPQFVPLTYDELSDCLGALDPEASMDLPMRCAAADLETIQHALASVQIRCSPPVRDRVNRDAVIVVASLAVGALERLRGLAALVEFEQPAVHRPA